MCTSIMDIKYTYSVLQWSGLFGWYLKQADFRKSNPGSFFLWGNRDKNMSCSFPYTPICHVSWKFWSIQTCMTFRSMLFDCLPEWKPEEFCPLSLNMATFSLVTLSPEKKGCILWHEPCTDRHIESAQSEGQLRPVQGGLLWGLWFYKAQNKKIKLIAEGFLSASTPPPPTPPPTHFHRKMLFMELQPADGQQACVQQTLIVCRWQ